jgi:hypothetical protein
MLTTIGFRNSLRLRCREWPPLRHGFWDVAFRVSILKTSNCRIAGDQRHQAAAFNSLHVSYVAQTQEQSPVILHSPECVDGAATADS